MAKFECVVEHQFLALADPAQGLDVDTVAAFVAVDVDPDQRFAILWLTKRALLPPTLPSISQCALTANR